jgi:hypothetical protein
MSLALTCMRGLALNWQSAVNGTQKARRSFGRRFGLSGIVAHSLSIAGPSALPGLQNSRPPELGAGPWVDRLGFLAGLTFHDQGGNGVTKIMKYHFYRLVKYLRMGWREKMNGRGMGTHDR